MMLRTTDYIGDWSIYAVEHRAPVRTLILYMPPERAMAHAIGKSTHTECIPHQQKEPTAMINEKGFTKEQFSTVTGSSLESVLETYDTLIKEGKLQYVPEEEAEARFDEILQRRRLREAQPVR